MTRPAVTHDPRARLGVSTAALLATAGAASRGRVAPWEAKAFRAVNGLPRLGPAGRALTLSAVPVVGLTRVYIGAHLPLDIAGGAALGFAIDAVVGMATGT